MYEKEMFDRNGRESKRIEGNGMEMTEKGRKGIGKSREIEV